MEGAGALSGDHRRRSMLNLPRGYHFAPTEDELIVHYLRRKIAGLKPLLPIFQDADDVSRSPEEITEEYKEFGEDGRWYFFTHRHRKYLSGNRPNRTTVNNECWKATGPQRDIKIKKGEEEIRVGRVRTLVFYGAPPKEIDPVTGLPTGKKKKAQSEEKTSWTMYEYENLTSEEDPADHNANKLEEWVLCTIQHQKKKDGGEEGSGVGEKEVKETEGKGKVKAASKKRKGKQEEIKAENIADHQAQIQDLQAMKRPKVSMLPLHQEETFAPEEGYESGMFDYNSCPVNSSPVLPMQHDESPLSEIVSPSITDNDNCYHQNMAPAPSLHESQRSEMMSTPSGGNCNIVSPGSNVMSSTSWCHGLILTDILPPGWLAGYTNSCNTSIAPLLVQQEPPHPRIRTEYETSSYSGYSNHNFARNMVTHQPDTNYTHPHSVAAPTTATYSYWGDAQNTADHHCSYGQADPGFMELLLNTGAMSSHSPGRRFAVSQYHGGPSALGQGRAVAPAAALPRQDQVTART